MCLCVHAYVHVCVYVQTRLLVCACARACVRACARAHAPLSGAPAMSIPKGAANSVGSPSTAPTLVIGYCRPEGPHSPAPEHCSAPCCTCDSAFRGIRYAFVEGSCTEDAISNAAVYYTPAMTTTRVSYAGVAADQTSFVHTGLTMPGSDVLRMPPCICWPSLHCGGGACAEVWGLGNLRSMGVKGHNPPPPDLWSGEEGMERW